MTGGYHATLNRTEVCESSVRAFYPIVLCLLPPSLALCNWMKRGETATPGDHTLCYYLVADRKTLHTILIVNKGVQQAVGVYAKRKASRSGQPSFAPR